MNYGMDATLFKPHNDMILNLIAFLCILTAKQGPGVTTSPHPLTHGQRYIVILAGDAYIFLS